MKPAFIALLTLCLCLTGCGHSTETIEANVQKTIQTKYDSDPTTKGGIVDNVDLKKAGGNKYTGFIDIIEADGSKVKLDLEVTVDGDVFKWTVKPPRELSAKANSKPAIPDSKNGKPKLEPIAGAKKPVTVLWEFETGHEVSSSPAIGSDGTVYVGSSDKKLYAIKIDSEGPAKSPWPMRGQNPQHTGRATK
jgi:outer membrane protein assembly factor BamB